MKRASREKLIEHIKNFGEVIELDKLPSRPLIPEAKSFSLPKEEVLLIFKKNGNQVEFKEFFKDEKKILFGLPPCEAKALYLVDLTFLNDKKDPYYARRRENTYVFVLACRNPRKTCFCKSFGLGPFSRDFGDVFMIDLGTHLLVEPTSPKGDELLRDLPLEDATQEDLEKAEELRKQAEEKVESLDLEGIDKHLRKLFSHDIWKSVAFKCVNCGTCTFVCPTCYCFDIQDIARTNWGYRERVWDSCMFSIYSLETSGHNPRPTGVERVRNRILHKFSYYPELYGEFGCVGCGRCITACPVNFDIREVLKSLKEVEVEV